MKKLMSLIIPVFKVEEYIEECLDSIIKQIDERFEVIIVNDGTPDNSMEIVECYLCNLPQNIRNCFILLTQENQGQSVARNNAINIAKGEYVGFLDSDDYLADEYFSMIIDRISNKPDIISFGAKVFDDKSKKITNILNINLINPSFNFDKYIIQSFDNCHWMCCLRVLNLEFLKKNYKSEVYFVKGYYLEDVILYTDLYLKADKIEYLNIPLYFYRSRINSSTSSFNIKFLESYDFAFDYLINNSIGNFDLYKLTLRKMMRSYIYISINNGVYKRLFLFIFKYIKVLDLFLILYMHYTFLKKIIKFLRF